MRIRKAEKLLGFTSENPAARSPPTPWDSAAAVVAAAGHLCEINRSCCVDGSINLRSSNPQKEESGIENDDEEMIGVVRKGSDDKQGRDKQEEQVEYKEETKNEREAARKRREKEAEETGMIKREKMYGEAWHCNLKPLRSYLPRLEEKISGDDRWLANRPKKSAAAVEAGTGTASNYYNNYSGLRIDSCGSAGGGNESSELDDEFDREALADNPNDADDEVVDGGTLCNFDYKKKTRPLKKRGRKPVKARSLKSLLSFQVCG